MSRWNEWTTRGNTFNYPHKLKELTHIFSSFSHFVARLAQPGPMTFSKKNLNACPQFLVVPHRCCTNVFFHHSWVEVQPARTKFREAYCLVRSAINRSAINRRIVEYHSVSKYSQHCSSCWAQCVFLVKLTCQLYLQVHWNRTSICSQQWFPARRPLSSGRHCAAKNSDSLEMMAAASAALAAQGAAVDADEESADAFGNYSIPRTNPRRPSGTWLIKNTLLIGSELWISRSKCLL